MPQTFNFPYHTMTEVWPDNSPIMKFGRGYTFAARPKGPPQRTYRLSFETMQVFVNSNGTVNRTINPLRNMMTLKDFYTFHQLFEPFIYPHIEGGNVNVRFAKPLEYKYKRAGLGTTEPFSLELMELP